MMKAHKLVCGLVMAVAVFATSALTVAKATVPETIAREAILVDVATGSVLFEKDADRRTTTASMSKVMTAYMVFDLLKQGKASLEQKITISENAWKIQGSKTFVELGNQVSVSDLVQGMIVQSGNDASVALAEGLFGSETGFAEAATSKAKELGMTGSNFANATGWPDPNHYSTMRDLATLAVHLINEFPEYYHYYAQKEFTYHGIRQHNRNPLLSLNIGADGIKTGHTEENGYGLIGSAIQNGRRLVVVVNGLPDDKARASEAARLLQWGFTATNSYSIMKAGAVADEARVWMGTQSTVPLVLPKDINMVMSKDTRASLKAEVVLTEPVAAPISKGQQIGVLRVSAPGLAPRDYPLEAGSDVAKLGFVGQTMAKVRHFLLGE
jgi:D-alanyl-D-alanine carboxypeptidase (penicillin-binding protein 5/6)